MSLVKALYTSAQHSLSSCVLCMGHTDNNASVNTGPKLLLFRVFKGQKKREKNGKKKPQKTKQESERLMFWSQILSLLENVHSCLVNQRIFWEKN